MSGGAASLELVNDVRAARLDTELGRIWESKTQQTYPGHLTFLLQRSPSRTRLLSSFERSELRTRTRPFSWTKDDRVPSSRRNIPFPMGGVQRNFLGRGWGGCPDSAKLNFASLCVWPLRVDSGAKPRVCSSGAVHLRFWFLFRETGLLTGTQD